MARIMILGGGWYGCHLALSLKDEHDVTLHEITDSLFSGASGGIPARLHQGQHYPRSSATRQLCQSHRKDFMERYGFLTRQVPVNIYAIAQDESLVDFGTYQKILREEIEYITLDDPEEFGLRNVEGAILTGERHIVISEARHYFEDSLKGIVQYNSNPKTLDCDLIIDCTFCARDNVNVDRYEPCVTGIVSGRTDIAVTIMDGPFPSLYPWDEKIGFNSVTSALYTPMAKCDTWEEAKEIIDFTDERDIKERLREMYRQVWHYYPRARSDYDMVPMTYKLSIRAMPKSGADARLVDVVQTDDKTLRVRAGKIDAVLHAEELVREHLG